MKNDDEVKDFFEEQEREMSPRVKELIRACALKNDDIRKGIPVNWLVNRILYEKVVKKIHIEDFMRVKLWNVCLVLTPKVLESQSIWAILDKTQNFKDFCFDNDPYKEHDFGNFKIKNEGTFYFKFDYFKDNSMEF